MAGADDVHISNIERVLKTGRDALFGVRGRRALRGAAARQAQQLQRQQAPPAAHGALRVTSTGVVLGSEGHQEQPFHTGEAHACGGAVRAPPAHPPHPLPPAAPQIILQVVNFMQMLVFPLCVLAGAAAGVAVAHVARGTLFPHRAPTQGHHPA